MFLCCVIRTWDVACILHIILFWSVMDTENVKERLNTLLHKKITEHEKDTKATPPSEPVCIKLEVDSDKKAQQHQVESPEIQQDNLLENAIKDQATKSFLLHEILSEKKRALLQDKEVVAFFQNKTK